MALLHVVEEDVPVEEVAGILSENDFCFPKKFTGLRKELDELKEQVDQVKVHIDRQGKQRNQVNEQQNQVHERYKVIIEALLQIIQARDRLLFDLGHPQPPPPTIEEVDREYGSLLLDSV